MEEPKKEQKPAMENRRCFVLVIAGAYLVYTGYSLCQNVLNGTEDTGWGFFAAGIAFAVIGAGMLIVGVKNYLKNQKEKKAEEDKAQAGPEQEGPALTQEQAEIEPVSGAEENQASEKESPEISEKEEAAPAPKRRMTIAERARLTDRLKDSEEENDQ